MLIQIVVHAKRDAVLRALVALGHYRPSGATIMRDGAFRVRARAYRFANTRS